MREEILKWYYSTEAEKESIIYSIFNKIKRDNNLNISLEYTMPIGYESANGITDISQNKVFINFEEAKRDTSIMPIFTLVHEMRHVMQYSYEEKFSPLLVRSLQYAIMYDGKAFKLVDNRWVQCILQEQKENCEELYLLSPNEIDANKYVYDYLINIVPELKEELDEILNFWLPKYLCITEEVAEDEMKRIYDYIDKNTK